MQPPVPQKRGMCESPKKTQGEVRCDLHPADTTVPLSQVSGPSFQGWSPTESSRVGPVSPDVDDSACPHGNAGGIK